MLQNKFLSALCRVVISQSAYTLHVHPFHETSFGLWTSEGDLGLRTFGTTLLTAYREIPAQGSKVPLLTSLLEIQIYSSSLKYSNFLSLGFFPGPAYASRLAPQRLLEPDILSTMLSTLKSGPFYWTCPGEVSRYQSVTIFNIPLNISMTV